MLSPLSLGFFLIGTSDVNAEKDHLVPHAFVACSCGFCLKVISHVLLSCINHAKCFQIHPKPLLVMEHSIASGLRMRSVKGSSSGQVSRLLGYMKHAHNYHTNIIIIGIFWIQKIFQEITGSL